MNHHDTHSLHQAAFRIRTLLHAEVSGLIARGLVQADQLLGYDGGAGAENVPRDLGLLTSIIRAAWPQVRGTCAVDEQQLEAVERLCLHLH